MHSIPTPLHPHSPTIHHPLHNPLHKLKQSPTLHARVQPNQTSRDEVADGSTGFGEDYGTSRGGGDVGEEFGEGFVEGGEGGEEVFLKSQFGGNSA